MKNHSEGDAHPVRSITFPYHSCRNITCPDDEEAGRKVFSGHAPLTSIFELQTEENVRDYFLEADGMQRRRPTQVNEAILDTLSERPGNFSVLSGGVVIVARGVENDDKKRQLRLIRPNIINGSQTQGVILDYFRYCEKNHLEFPDVHIKYELVVTDNEDLIAEISIARNYQNNVMAISIAGRLGQLNELEARLKDGNPEARLKKKETERDTDKYIDTEKLLQVIAALTPSELWPKQNEADNPNKVYTYSMKAKCLKDFQEIYKSAKDTSAKDHKIALERYEYYLDIAPQALELYEKWKHHQGFKGTGIRTIERDEAREIKDVPDGIIFPIIAALSPFVHRTATGWVLAYPSLFDRELINAAARALKEIANHNPWNMGKSKACYSSIYQLTSLYKKLLTHTGSGDGIFGDSGIDGNSDDSSERRTFVRRQHTGSTQQ